MHGRVRLTSQVRLPPRKRPWVKDNAMDYDKIFSNAIEALHEEGRYRVFIDILRNKGSFPNARCFAGHNGPKPITVWCSNDYLGQGQNRMAGSMLAQVTGQFGDIVPDVDDPQQLKALVAAINQLRSEGKLLAYHDRSDGGLLATVAEMAFAGHVGVALNIDMLVTEGDGIADSRAEYGDAKNWAKQVSARREELTVKALFSEELGVVLQVRTADRNAVMATLREHGLSKHSHFIGKTRPLSSGMDVGKGQLQVWRDTQAVFSASLFDLHQVWDSVSWKICQQRDNPVCADQEHAAAGVPQVAVELVEQHEFRGEIGGGETGLRRLEP